MTESNPRLPARLHVPGVPFNVPVRHATRISTDWRVEIELFDTLENGQQLNQAVNADDLLHALSTAGTVWLDDGHRRPHRALVPQVEKHYGGTGDSLTYIHMRFTHEAIREIPEPAEADRQSRLWNEARTDYVLLNQVVFNPEGRYTARMRKAATGQKLNPETSLLDREILRSAGCWDGTPWLQLAGDSALIQVGSSMSPMVVLHPIDDVWWVEEVTLYPTGRTRVLRPD